MNTIVPRKKLANRLWWDAVKRSARYIAVGSACFLFLVLVIAGLAYAAYRIVSYPLLTSFQANVDTTTLQFEVGDWKESVGLFVSDDTPIDLTLQEAGSLRANAPSSAHDRLDLPEGSLATAAHVYLNRMDLLPGTKVGLTALDNAIEIRLQRPAASQEPLATFLADSGSSIDGHPLATQKARAKQQWSVYPTDGQHLTLTLLFKGALPVREDKIPLLPQSSFRMEDRGQPSIVGAKSDLLLPRQQKDPLRLENSRLELDHLESGILQDLEFNPPSKESSGTPYSFHLVLTGRTKDIKVVSAYTGMTSSYADQRGDRLQNPISSRSRVYVITAFVGLLSGLSTIATLLAAFAQIAGTQDQLVDHQRTFSQPSPPSRPKGSFHALRRRPRRSSPRAELSSRSNAELGGPQDRDR